MWVAFQGVECVRFGVLSRKRKSEEVEMRRSLFVVAVTVGMIVAWSVGRVQGQGEGKVLFVAANKADYKAGPDKGVSMAAVWGDAAAGAHGTWTKFDPGYDAGMHTHTNDVWIVGV